MTPGTKHALLQLVDCLPLESSRVEVVRQVRRGLRQVDPVALEFEERSDRHRLYRDAIKLHLVNRVVDSWVKQVEGGFEQAVDAWLEAA